MSTMPGRSNRAREPRYSQLREPPTRSSSRSRSSKRPSGIGAALAGAATKSDARRGCDEQSWELEGAVQSAIDKTEKPCFHGALLVARGRYYDWTTCRRCRFARFLPSQGSHGDAGGQGGEAREERRKSHFEPVSQRDVSAASAVPSVSEDDRRCLNPPKIRRFGALCTSS
jgi:hypothetical protein